MRLRLVVVVALIASAALGAWFLRPRGEPVVGPGAEVGVAETVPLAAAPSALAGRAHPDGPRVPEGRCSIFGTVRYRGALVAARVEVAYLGPSVESLHLEAGTLGSLSAILSFPTRPAARWVRSGPDGRFDVADLAAGNWRVTAITDDGASGRADVGTAVEGARSYVELLADWGSESLRARVEHADGTPFRGHLLVSGWGEAAHLAGLARSRPVPLDADGRMEVRGLKPGAYVLTAIVPDRRMTRSERIEVPAAGVVRFMVDEGLVARRGRVVAESGRTSIAGAMVFGVALDAEEGAHLGQVTSGGDGGFDLLLPRLGGVLRVVAAGYAPYRIFLHELPEPPAPLEVRLLRGAEWSGRVTAEEDGAPVANVAVHAIPKGHDAPWCVPPPVYSDDLGRFHMVDLVPGVATVFASGAGRISPELAMRSRSGVHPLEVMFHAGSRLETDLVVARGRFIRGVVRDESDRPVAGAVVRGAADVDLPDRDVAVPVGPVTTAADGTFRLEGVAPGVGYYVGAAAPDGGSGSARVPPDGTGDGVVEIGVNASLTVNVLVRDAETELPIAGASIGSGQYYRVPDLPGGVQSITTGVDGTAQWVIRGRKWLSAWAEAPGYLPRSLDWSRDSGASLTFALVRGYTLEGRVCLPDGSPAAGADVRLHPLDDVEASIRLGRRCDRLGRFDLVFRGRAPWSLRARLGSGGREWSADGVGEPGGEPVVLVLAPHATRVPRPGALVVNVVDPEGRPIPRARAELRSPVRDHVNEVVEDGRVVFDGKRRGGEWVVVDRPTTADGEALPFGVARVGPVPEGEPTVTVRMAPALTIEGMVRGPNGQGVRGVLLEASDSHRVATDRSDGEGRFRLAGLGPGAWWLTAHAPLEFVSSEPVWVEAGVRDALVALRASVSARVTILDTMDQPVAAQRVFARDETEGAPIQHNEASTGGDGVAVFHGLDPESTYRFWVQSSDAIHVEHDAFPSGAPSDFTIRVERRFEVRGVVRDPQGRPIPEVGVTAVTDGAKRRVTTDRRGDFVVPGLARGDVLLQVSLPGHGSDAATTVRTVAGARDLVVVLDPGVELLVHLENWAETTFKPAVATLFGPPDDPHRIHIEAKISSDGTVRFPGVLADLRYTLWIPSGGDGLCVFRSDVRADAPQLRVSLTRGWAITGQIAWPSGVKADAVRVYALASGLPIEVTGIVWPDGSYEVDGLFAGDWTVIAAVRFGEQDLIGTSVTAAGGRANLTLK